MSRKVLTVEYDYDFILMGILCQEKDYRLCHEINKKLNMEFKKEDDLEIIINKQKESSGFSLYSYINEDEHSFYLIGNKSLKGFLIPEQKQMDYFFMIKGNLFEDEKKDIAQMLKQIPMIMGTYELEPMKLKSKENLIF